MPSPLAREYKAKDEEQRTNVDTNLCFRYGFTLRTTKNTLMLSRPINAPLSVGHPHVRYRQGSENVTRNSKDLITQPRRIIVTTGDN